MTRSWLKEARRTVIDRFKGIGHGEGPTERQPRTDERNRAIDEFVHPDIRPNMLLRYSGSGKWSVVMEVPNFSSVAALASDLRTFLKQTRCRLAGATDTKPAGWVLSGNRIGILKSWPNPENPLLEFERTHPILNGLLKSDCLMSAGSTWPFRAGSDG